jgi:hypothetical protein
VINHGLNTRAVLVSIHRNAAPYDEVETEVQKTSGSVTVLFNTAPTLNQYVVSLKG